MDTAKDNANPTIINPFDLPSRRRAVPAAAAKRRRIFDALVPSLADPSRSPSIWSGAPPASDATSSDVDSGASDDELAYANEQLREEIDEQEVFDLISTITDPEHPLTLGSLGVVNLDDIKILPPTSPRSRISSVRVLLTPTTSACSLTTVIGLGVKVRLVNALPPRFRVDVRIKEGTSSSADEANKQLGDKERVAAAIENRNLLNMVNHMLSSCDA